MVGPFPLYRNLLSQETTEREDSSDLEDLLALSSAKSLLTDVPPDVNNNVYSSIISFGLDHCKGLMLFLLKLLVKNEKPVQEKDVVRLSFLFSLIAHGVNRNNNSLAKTKSLLLQAQGVTIEGSVYIANLKFLN